MGHMLHDFLNLTTAGALVLLVVLWSRVHRGRVWEAVAVALMAAVCLGHQMLFSMVAEDAFITYRYALNLASGHGPVFNIGERVEGYSCFLWMVLLALSHSISGVPLEEIGKYLGGAVALGALVMTHLLGRRATGDPRAGVTAVAMLACSGSFAAWGPSGMETPLFALLAAWSVYCALGGSLRAAGVLVGLAVMTRPDGLLVVAALTGWLLLRPAAQEGGAGRWRALLPFALPLAALMVPWTAWRLWYYGHLIPNAVAAKAGAELQIQLWWGLKYFYKFTQANPLLLGMLLAVTAAGIQRLRGRLTLERTDLLVGGLPLVGVLFVIAVGGDWMPAWRFFAPWLPLACVALARAWQLFGGREEPDAARPLATSVAQVMLCLGLWQMSLFNFDMLPAVRQWSERVRSSSIVGAWMGSTLPEGTTVATYANGSISYRAGSKIRFLDMLGLTDEHIARHGHRNSAMGPGHMANDLDYVARRKPPVIMFSSGTTSPQPVCHGNARFNETHMVAVFALPGKDLPMGNIVNLQILRTQKKTLISRLASAPGVKRLKPNCPTSP